jgi:hypothetical protein
LSPDTQRAATRAYETWCRDPFHPSLDFKQVHGDEPIFSVRAGLHWRAVGVRKGDVMIWFWIGSHNDYDNLLKRL